MKEETGIGPLLYAIFKSKEAFANALEEYKIYARNEQKSSDQMMVQGVRILLDETMKKYDMVQFFPESARPIVKALISQPFSYTVDLLSAAMKEYAKDKATGEYRTTEEVLGQVAKDFLKSKIVEKIFES